MTHYLSFKYITDQRSFSLSLKSEKEISDTLESKVVLISTKHKGHAFSVLVFFWPASKIKSSCWGWNLKLANNWLLAFCAVSEISNNQSYEWLQKCEATVLVCNLGPMASQSSWSEALTVHKDCSSGDRNGACKDAQQLFRLVNFVCCLWAINPAKRQLRQRQTNKPKPDEEEKKKTDKQWL